MTDDDHSRDRAGAADRPSRASRLWVVSELYYPEQTSTGYFLTRIAEGLADDFEVCVVSGQPTYSERGLRAAPYEERRGTKIHRVRATHFNKDSLPLRAANAITLTLGIFWFSLRNFRPGDKVLAVTNPPTLPLVVGLAARLRRCQATLLVHDVYPELLAATGILRPSSLAYRALARLFARTYRLFGGIVVLGRDMAEAVTGKLGGDGSLVRIIPNWGDVEEVRPIPAEENSFRRDHGLEGKFIVQFSGNIGRTHDVELLLRAARSLSDDARILFLFVGYGGKSRLVANATREGAGNVRFLPRQPRERLGEMLSASDLTVISFVDGMYGISVPSRMYNVMAAGTPIVAIADSRSELALTVAEAGAGWVLDSGGADEFVALVRWMAAAGGRTEARRRGAAGRAAVMERYTLESVLEQYRDLLR